jgi:hypothetical protein
MQKILRVAAALAVVVACPSTAAAQSTPEWTDKVKTGTSIFVMTTDGVQIDGVAGPVTPEGLTVYTSAGRQMIPFDRAFRIEKRDSSKTGLLYGAAAGWVYGYVDVRRNDCSIGWVLGFCRGDEQFVYLVTAGVGALIGWAIDAAVPGRSTIYEARQVARVSLKLAPTRGAISVTW